MLLQSQSNPYSVWQHLFLLILLTSWCLWTLSSYHFPAAVWNPQQTKGLAKTPETVLHGTEGTIRLQVDWKSLSAYSVCDRPSDTERHAQLTIGKSSQSMSYPFHSYHPSAPDNLALPLLRHTSKVLLCVKLNLNHFSFMFHSNCLNLSCVFMCVVSLRYEVLCHHLKHCSKWAGHCKLPLCLNVCERNTEMG